MLIGPYLDFGNIHCCSQSSTEFMPGCINLEGIKAIGRRKSLVISLRVVKTYLGGGLDVVVGEYTDIEKEMIT